MFKKKSKEKIEYWHSSNGRWYFHKVAGNGETTMSSQGYKQKRYLQAAVKREYPDLYSDMVNITDPVVDILS